MKVFSHCLSYEENEVVIVHNDRVIHMIIYIHLKEELSCSTFDPFSRKLTSDMGLNAHALL